MWLRPLSSNCLCLACDCSHFTEQITEDRGGKTTLHPAGFTEFSTGCCHLQGPTSIAYQSLALSSLLTEGRTGRFLPVPGLMAEGAAGAKSAFPLELSNLQVWFTQSCRRDFEAIGLVLEEGALPSLGDKTPTATVTLSELS